MENSKKEILNTVIKKLNNTNSKATKLTLYEVACEMNIPHEKVSILFPGGLMSVIDMYSQEMLAEFTQDDKTISAVQGSSSIREKVYILISASFRCVEHDRRALVKFLKYIIKTGNLVKAPMIVSKISDAIWNGVNSTMSNTSHSKDFTFYSKRASLSFLYSRLMIYFLRNGYTEKFNELIYSGVYKVAKISKVKQRIKSVFRFRTQY